MQFRAAGACLMDVKPRKTRLVAFSSRLCVQQALPGGTRRAASMSPLSALEHGPEKCVRFSDKTMLKSERQGTFGDSIFTESALAGT